MIQSKPYSTILVEAFLWLTLLLVTGCGNGQSETSKSRTSIQPTIVGRGVGEAYAFPFFYGYDGAEKEGMWMAISRDGLDWNVVNDNNVLLKRPFGSVFRDPAVSQGPDGIYHLVWTMDWDNPSSIGYAHSEDLIHWEGFQQCKLMDSVPGTINLWAPELFYDKDNGRWMIYWGSSVAG